MQQRIEKQHFAFDLKDVLQEHEMPGAGDGQELSQPLHQAQ